MKIQLPKISKVSSSLILSILLGLGASTTLRAQPGPPGGPGMGGPRPPLPAIVRALDLNGDGIIDSNEIAHASESLKKLDKNGDGQLTPDEYLGARPDRRGGLGEFGGNGGPNRRPAAISTGPHDSNLPAIFKKFTNVVEMYREGDYAVIRTKDVPTHHSVYFDRSDPRYAAYDGPNPSFHVNPERIREQDFVFRIPLHPEKAATHRMTPLGPFGVAVNGVVLFNQFAAGRKTLTFEANSFDQFNGHPAPGGTYHYHVEPLYVSQTAGRDALVGILLDGFPVYGPEENGRTLANHDLDDFHGHFGSTKEYPEGIYHYHVTAEVPYINGGEFYGTPGDVSR